MKNRQTDRQWEAEKVLLEQAWLVSETKGMKPFNVTFIVRGTLVWSYVAYFEQQMQVRACIQKFKDNENTWKSLKKYFFINLVPSSE